jgi:hypothetical protein
MKTRMWIVETDQYGMTDRKFYVDDPDYIPRRGDFIDGGEASGYVKLVQWNFSTAASQKSSGPSTVYVSLEQTPPKGEF